MHNNTTLTWNHSNELPNPVWLKILNLAFANTLFSLQETVGPNDIGDFRVRFAAPNQPGVYRYPVQLGSTYRLNNSFYSGLFGDTCFIDLNVIATPTCPPLPPEPAPPVWPALCAIGLLQENVTATTLPTCTAALPTTSTGFQPANFSQSHTAYIPMRAQLFSLATEGKGFCGAHAPNDFAGFSVNTTTKQALFVDRRSSCAMNNLQTLLAHDPLLDWDGVPLDKRFYDTVATRLPTRSPASYIRRIYYDVKTGPGRFRKLGEEVILVAGGVNYPLYVFPPHLNMVLTQIGQPVCTLGTFTLPTVLRPMC